MLKRGEATTKNETILKYLKDFNMKYRPNILFIFDLQAHKS